MLQTVLADNALSISERLIHIHDEVREKFSHICRVAVAVYDPETDLVKTFAHSTDGPSPINFYEMPLSSAPSLKELSEQPNPRVIDDLRTVRDAKSSTLKLASCGYLSSMTVPIRYNGSLYGFLFFNSVETNYFTQGRLSSLRAYAAIISMLVINELQMLRTLKGAVKTAREFSRQRDEETGNHLERMSRYARLIAKDLAPAHHKDEDWVEYVFQFAPLHDVGKVAVPDEILLKPGKLTCEEFEAMKKHVVRGSDLIDVMAQQFGLNTLNNFQMLKNIVLYHHESLDGTGYPCGISGDEIPLEARIVAVADIFDALTSRRPYKEPWSNQRAAKLLQVEAGVRLDAACVNSLLSHMGRIEKIQNEFGEDFIG